MIHNPLKFESFTKKSDLPLCSGFYLPGIPYAWPRTQKNAAPCILNFLFGRPAPFFEFVKSKGFLKILSHQLP